MITILFALVLSVGAVLSAHQASGGGEIAGRITDSFVANPEPYPLAGVRVIAVSGDYRSEAITDEDGRFAIPNLALGTYRITVELIGFAPRHGTITLDEQTKRAQLDWSLKVSALEIADRVLFADERLIREARARSNAAIAAHDPVAIARIWMADVHVVSSTSAQVAGREANQQRMARQFATRPDTIYVRKAATIDVYPEWAVAAERGEWTGRWTEPDGVMQIGGTYLVQWRKVDGQWLIQAELYVPTRCSGSQYCRERP
ncbi:MAG TPA: carboxypeptidase regulatory-like domain-containing protein [Vicinamibacterales bacterium]|nr:carboxypeptidase regulatory-like domain-containing protein [Vicinamibacterales bacterium]